MARAKMEQIKRYYRQLFELRKTIEQDKKSTLKTFTIDMYNNVVDKISKSMEDDYSEYKVPPNEMKHNPGNGMQGPSSWYSEESISSRLSLVIGLLKSEIGVDDFSPQNNGNFVTLINNNTIGINITHTINQLIEEEEDKEVKVKLKELNAELEKPKKDWGKIKTLLIWIVNFSEKLFFAVLPELLKRYNS